MNNYSNIVDKWNLKSQIYFQDLEKHKIKLNEDEAEYSEKKKSIKRLDELFIQKLWFRGYFGNVHKTICGKRVEILENGYWNHSIGPDFKNVVIKINEEVLKGDLEIDMTATDWYLHGHHDNERFDNCILHVSVSKTKKETFIQNSKFKLIPRVILKVDLDKIINLNTKKITKKDNESKNIYPGKCAGVFRKWNFNQIHNFLLEAREYRVYKKSQRIIKSIKVNGEEKTLFYFLAEALGYVLNKKSMRLLAECSDLTYKRGKDRVSRSIQLKEKEALRFGLAGFLNVGIFDKADSASRAYLKELWNIWWKRSGNFSKNLKEIFKWELAGIRPINHPQRRIGALCAIEKEWDTFMKILDVRELNLKNLEKSMDSLVVFFKSLEHSFWSYHYTLTSKKTEKKMALIGVDRINDILINIIIPYFYLKFNKSRHVFDIYNSLKISSRNSVIKRLEDLYFSEFKLEIIKSKGLKTSNVLANKEIGVFFNKSGIQQALLQLEDDFCAKSHQGCRSCPLPNLLKVNSHS